MKNSLTLRFLAKGFVLGNMGWCFIDSIIFFYRLYSISFETAGFSFFVLTYFFIVYWKKVNEIGLTTQLKCYFIGLRFLLLLILLTPIFFTPQWEIVIFHPINAHQIVIIAGQIIKIFGVELCVEILFYFITTVENPMFKKSIITPTVSAEKSDTLNSN
jgi:hypothetical protein